MKLVINEKHNIQQSLTIMIFSMVVVFHKWYDIFLVIDRFKKSFKKSVDST